MSTKPHMHANGDEEHGLERSAAEVMHEINAEVVSILNPSAPNWTQCPACLFVRDVSTQYCPACVLSEEEVKALLEAPDEDDRRRTYVQLPADIERRVSGVECRRIRNMGVNYAGAKLRKGDV